MIQVKDLRDVHALDSALNHNDIKASRKSTSKEIEEHTKECTKLNDHSFNEVCICNKKPKRKTEYGFITDLYYCDLDPNAMLDSNGADY